MIRTTPHPVQLQAHVIIIVPLLHIFETYDRYLSETILTLKMCCWHGSTIKSLRSGVRVVEGLLG